MSAGRLLRLPHGTARAAVITIKNRKFRSFMSNENIYKKDIRWDIPG